MQTPEGQVTELSCESNGCRARVPKPMKGSKGVKDSHTCGALTDQSIRPWHQLPKAHGSAGTERVRSSLIATAYEEEDSKERR
jgi:hypothetical protein